MDNKQRALWIVLVIMMAAMVGFSIGGLSAFVYSRCIKGKNKSATSKQAPNASPDEQQPGRQLSIGSPYEPQPTVPLDEQQQSGPQSNESQPNKPYDGEINEPQPTVSLDEQQQSGLQPAELPNEPLNEQQTDRPLPVEQQPITLLDEQQQNEPQPSKSQLNEQPIEPLNGQQPNGSLDEQQPNGVLNEQQPNGSSNEQLRSPGKWKREPGELVGRRIKQLEEAFNRESQEKTASNNRPKSDKLDLKKHENFNKIPNTRIQENQSSQQLGYQPEQSNRVPNEQQPNGALNEQQPNGIPNE